MRNQYQLSSLALPDATTSLPTEFCLFRFGVSRAEHLGGEEMQFTLDADGAASIMAAFADRGLDSLPFDLDHQMLDGGPTFDSGKAVGWFVPAVKDDGLYASSIKWTPEGEALLKGKAYRFFSPAFFTDEDGRIVELINVALTNLPATKNIPALVAASARARKEPLNMKILLTALGLAEDADEAKIAGAVEGLKADHAALIALSGAQTHAEAVGVFTALKAQAEAVTQLTAEVTQLRAEKAQAEVEALLDAATRDGRLTPAMRASMVAFNAEHGTKALRTTLSLLPKQPGQAAPAVEAKPETNPSVTLTAEELTIAKSLGIDAQAFAATKLARVAAK